MHDPLIETDQLTKRYGATTALLNCSLRVERGEVFGLLGPNGSGKTTLIRLLLGYLRPTAGRATINGLDCYHDSLRVHELLSYLPGEARLFGQMRGREVLQFFSRLHPRANLDRAFDLARRLELELDRQVAFCSTGMRQKIALISTLAVDVPLIVLDEPTSSLDPTVRGQVTRLVREAKVEGRTILFSSHVLSEVEEACDRACILRLGEQVHLQVIAELRQQHRVKAHLKGPLPDLPAELRDLPIEHTGTNEVQIQTAGQLPALLRWLATVPIADVEIEPIRLKAVYDRYHGPEAA